MSPKPPLKSDDPAQSERFIEAGRKAKGDESESGAKRSFDNFIREARPKGPSSKQKDSR
jgi:hypothetical protein